MRSRHVTSVPHTDSPSRTTPVPSPWQLADIQEQERERIARDLHDTLGQRVTALRFKIESLRQAAPPKWRRGMDDLLELANLIDSDLDLIAWDLRPPALEGGIVCALRGLVRDWSTIHRIPVTFQSRQLTEELSPGVEECLYRIAQEALSNVVKHARAQRVAVLLNQASTEVVLIVEDDGCGFDVGATKSSASLTRAIGLRSMAERAALVGGSLQVESEPGHGAALFVRVPVVSRHA